MNTPFRTRNWAQSISNECENAGSLYLFYFVFSIPSQYLGILQRPLSEGEPSQYFRVQSANVLLEKEGHAVIDPRCSNPKQSQDRSIQP